MSQDIKAPFRAAKFLLLQRVFSIGSALLFAVLLPRLMEPELYGRYSFLNSLSFCFVVMSSLGLTQTIGRFAPQLAAQGTKPLWQFFGKLLLIRLGTGTLASAAYLLFAFAYLHDIDMLVVVLMSLTVFARALANIAFVFFIGMNRAARWGMVFPIRGWLTLACVLPGFILWGLRGACLGLVAAEILVSLTGLLWHRSHLAWPKPGTFAIAPCLRFGLVFFAADLVRAAIIPAAELIVRKLSGSYTEVGYLGLSYTIYLIPALVIPQVVTGFTPVFVSLRTAGRIRELREQVSQLLKWVSIGGTLAVFAVLLLADHVVPIVLGEAYRPVATNLLALTGMLLVVGLAAVARTLAIAFDRPGTALASVLICFAGLACAAPYLVAEHQGFGACLSLLIANTLATIYLTWRMQLLMSYSLRPWVVPILLGALFLPLLRFGSSLLVNSALYLVFVIGYIGLILGLKIVRRTEIADILGHGRGYSEPGVEP